MTTYPDVPIAPGVPPVLRNPAAAAQFLVDLLTGDGPDALGSSPAAQWGIFDDSGQPVLTAKSVVVVDFRKEFRVSDYPIEAVSQQSAGFQSYNKVETPYDFKITLTQDNGSLQSFLTAIAAIVASTTLYNCVTPDAVYRNGNAVNYGYKRTAVNGVSLLSVDIFMEEIRSTATATFSNTADPTSNDPVQDGVLQPVTVTPAVSSSISDTFDAVGGF